MVDSINGYGSSNWADLQMQINTEELQKHRDKMFTRIDTNGDGGIDKTEFSALAKRISAFASAPSDPSTSIEATQGVDDIFSTYDANGDGKLSKDELGAYMKANHPRPPPDGMDGSMGAMKPQGAHNHRHRGEMFNKLDTNGDGGIDKTEFASLAEKISKHTGNTLDVDNIFSSYDTDGDGNLSKDELKNYMEANRPHAPTQNATSAYSANSGTDQISSLIDYLKGQATSDMDQASTINDYISSLLGLLNNKEGNDYNDILMNVVA